VTDPGILYGKPTVKGTRLSVEFIVDLLRSGWTTEEILEEHRRLKKEDLVAVFAFIHDQINWDSWRPDENLLSAG